MLGFLSSLFHWWMVFVPFIGIPVFLTLRRIWGRADPGHGKTWTGMPRVLLLLALFLIYGIWFITIVLNGLGAQALLGVPNPTVWGSEQFPWYAAAITAVPFYFVSGIEIFVLMVLIDRYVVDPFLRPFFNH